MDIISKRTFDQNGFQVVVTRVLDIDPDLSYLEQEYSGVATAERETYLAQDVARLEAYRNGEWCMVGVCVSVLKQTSSNWANGGFEVGRSSVWGIESDSDADYFAQIESEEITEAFGEVDRLKAVLA